MARAAENNITNIADALNRGDVDGALEAAELGAPGAVELSPGAQLAASGPTAGQGFPGKGEPVTSAAACRAQGTGLNRRTIMNMLVSATAIAGAVRTTAAVASVGSGDDAELVRLAAEISQLCVQEKSASAECARCYDIFKALEPEKPRALLWRIGDPVGHTDVDSIKLPNGSLLLWCDFPQIRKLAQRKEPFRQWFFDGTDDDWKKFRSMFGRNFQEPPKGYEHLFRSFPDDRRQERAAELVSAFNDWDAKCDRALDQSGSTAAEEAFERVGRKMSDAYKRMLELRPTTLEGYRALAQAMVENCWGGTIEAGDCGDTHGIAVILSTLTGIPITDAA